MRKKLGIFLLTALLLLAGCGERAAEAPQRTCTMSVSCAAAMERPELLPAGMEEVLPKDGIIFPATEVPLEAEDTAFSLLQRQLQEAKIPMEFVKTPVYDSAYIEGIANLYEFDCGDGSGWMFRINGVFPSGGSSLQVLEDGDCVEWLYTCNLGEDIGARKQE